jgi:hypothetical protein
MKGKKMGIEKTRYIIMDDGSLKKVPGFFSPWFEVFIPFSPGHKATLEVVKPGVGTRRFVKGEKLWIRPIEADTGERFGYTNSDGVPYSNEHLTGMIVRRIA